MAEAQTIANTHGSNLYSSAYPFTSASAPKPVSNGSQHAANGGPHGERPNPPPQAPPGQQPTQRPPQQQQQQQQQPPPLPPPPLPSAAQHQAQSTPGAPQMPFYQPYAVSVSQDAMRYPLPPNPDGRLMSGGRHKKEIKRRTKTGCLTCRKRRIKCDEGHPACRNCQKSKRECLGYDPIFKSQPGPPSIQTPTSSTPSMYHHSPTPYAPPPPHGYTPASYGAFILTPTPASPAPSQAATTTDNIKEEPSNSDSAVPDRKAKRTKIESLLCINGISPPPPAPRSALSEDTQREVRTIYLTAYAPGMDKFLETKWFTERGLEHLMANAVLCDQFALLVHRYAMNPQDPAYYIHFGITQSLEAMVVWSMLCMCRKVAKLRGDVEEEVQAGVKEAANRLEIYEALVTGEYLRSESAPKTPDLKTHGTPLQGQLKSREHEFWRAVYTFLTLHDDETENASAIDDTLTACRGLLERRENRDVIYSIMVVRHVGAQIPDFPNMAQPETNDEKDAHAKVAVAKKLIEDEAQGKGTNQVVQRLCGVAARTWALDR